MRQAEEIGVERPRVLEAAADVRLRRRLAQGDVVLVDANAPEEQGLPVQEKLLSARADLAEADPVKSVPDGIFVRCYVRCYVRGLQPNRRVQFPA